MAETTITCPSGLAGRIRGMKVREERILADRRLACSTRPGRRAVRGLLGDAGRSSEPRDLQGYDHWELGTGELGVTSGLH